MWKKKFLREITGVGKVHITPCTPMIDASKRGGVRK